MSGRRACWLIQGNTRQISIAAVNYAEFQKTLWKQPKCSTQLPQINSFRISKFNFNTILLS